MGHLTSAVHWWEQSQMRVLVLSSLVIQFLLFILSFARRHAIHKLFRSIMWIAYLASDAVAIFALATLFNRRKDQDRGGNNTLELEVVWAPILLIHLGGHDGITAYNIEDNELWSRHLLTAVSQVTVAIYVFWKSWPADGDKRLLQASILLFVPGVLKCFSKPWALKMASISSLVSSPAAKRTAKKGKGGEMVPYSLEKHVKGAKAFIQGQKDEGNKAHSGRACGENGDLPPPQQGKQNKDEMALFEEYVDFVVREQKGEHGERAPMEEDTEATRSRNERKRAEILYREAHKLFVDLSSPNGSCRLSIFKYFWVISQEKAETATTRNSKEEEDKAAPLDFSRKEEKADTAYGYVRRALASAFVLLYTKLKTAGVPTVDIEEASLTTLISQLIQLSRNVLPWAAIGLFHNSHREAYSDTDVKITYAILCCTAVLESYSLSPIVLAKKDMPAPRHPLVVTREQWPEVVAQYSLIGYFARNKNHSKIVGILSKLGCKDLVDQHWCMKPCLSSGGIAELVLQYLKAGWEKKIQDIASYCIFIDNRGHWALEGIEGLSWSIKGPFDENILLWHIATDLCSFSSRFSEHIQVCDFAKVSGSKICGQRLVECKAILCRQISNYMVYLLFVNPEMLLPGTRRNLFTTAYNDLERILRDNKLNPQSCCQKVEEKDLMETLINTMRQRSNKEVPERGSQEESKEGQPINEGSQENFIDDAWDLAKVLLKLRDDFGNEKMWEVIQGVWVEMLCFSASRCRGYLHAKALGSGGEFLSYVWLLLFYMGMETFAERLQREWQEPPSQEGNSNATPTPRASDSHNGNAATFSTSGIRSRGASSPSHVHTGSSTSSSEFHIVDMD